MIEKRVNVGNHQILSISNSEAFSDFIFIIFAPMEMFLRKNDSPHWGVNLIKKLHPGTDIISVSPIGENTWYRDRILQEYISKNIDVTRYKKRFGYGFSMGAYGVALYSNVLNIDKTILVSPISTLNKKTVPWQVKYKNFMDSCNWSDDSLHDASKSKSSNLIVYDPFSYEDKMHSLRFENSILIRVNFSGHNINPIINIGLIEYLLKSIHKCEFNKKIVHNKVSHLKFQPEYYLNALKNKKVKGNHIRKNVFKKYFTRRVGIEREKVALKLRDIALCIEKDNPNIALKIFLIAKEFKKNGTLINNKIQSLKRT